MKTYLFAASLLTLLFITLPAAAQHAKNDHKSTVEKPDAVLHVKGLSCSMCARSLTNSLKKLDAVDQVQVILEKDQRALLTLKGEKKVTEKELRNAVERAGFTTREVEFVRDDAGDDGS